ncbi:MAG: hypothetical protein ACYC0V_07870 [Armatimonadota bacterium]
MIPRLSGSFALPVVYGTLFSGPRRDGTGSGRRFGRDPPLALRMTTR